jgi:hypothetical protein
MLARAELDARAFLDTEQLFRANLAPDGYFLTGAEYL